MTDCLYAEHLSSGYGNHTIVKDVDLVLPEHKISVIIGSNGCGKSTLLKTLCKLVLPSNGAVYLNNKDIHKYPSKALAKNLGLIPQSPIVPEGITVADLVARGRFPYRQPLKGMSKEDYQIVSEAMDMMGISDLADRCVDELSGGQRQRVWLALALAQDTDILLLDEPTTFLDISYQIEILDLLTELNQKKGTTIAMVLHDINLSARYADYIFAISNGKLLAHGTPEEIINEEIIREVYGLNSKIIKDPITQRPMIIPIGKCK